MAVDDHIFIRKHEKAYSEGNVIFTEGDKSHEMYFILNGEVKVTKRVHDVIETLATLKKGDFFGEMSTFANRPRKTTVFASKNTKLVAVQLDSFQSMIENCPDFGLKVVKTICGRLERANEQIESLMFKNQIDKVTSILYNDSTDGGKRILTNTTLNYHDTLTKITKLTNLSSESIISFLGRLFQEGKIEIFKDSDVLLIRALPPIESLSKE
ncbi:MAG TPA: Crp/Fnr family transcriptional regulator [Spirochaetes bacterium]|nr:Crp/Fnr family transcriptional regulator [Spirochaetota bacterium]